MGQETGTGLEVGGYAGLESALGGGAVFVLVAQHAGRGDGGRGSRSLRFATG